MACPVVCVALPQEVRATVLEALKDKVLTEVLRAYAAQLPQAGLADLLSFYLALSDVRQMHLALLTKQQASLASTTKDSGKSRPPLRADPLRELACFAGPSLSGMMSLSR